MLFKCVFRGFKFVCSIWPIAFNSRPKFYRVVCFILFVLLAFRYKNTSVLLSNQLSFFFFNAFPRCPSVLGIFLSAQIHFFICLFVFQMATFVHSACLAGKRNETSKSHLHTSGCMERAGEWVRETSSFLTSLFPQACLVANHVTGTIDFSKDAAVPEASCCLPIYCCCSCCCFCCCSAAAKSSE